MGRIPISVQHRDINQPVVSSAFLFGRFLLASAREVEPMVSLHVRPAQSVGMVRIYIHKLI